MIESQVLFNKEAREKVKAGIDKAAKAVGVTLGIRGRNVIFSRIVQTQNGTQIYPARVTKDGVTVLRNFILPDPIEDIGAGIVREASKKTADVVGDGTTTTAILVQAIVSEGLKLIDEGINPMELQKGINKAVDYVVSKLKDLAHPVEDNDKIKQVATVSANNDEEIGKLIAEAYKTIGNDGLITVEDAKGLDTSIKVIDGFKIGQGFVSPYFMTDRGKGVAEFKNAYILYFESPIKQMNPLLPILEAALRSGNPLIIFCEELEGEALATLVNNVIQGKISVCVIKSPYYGERLIDAMEDMALLTGGQFLSIQKGIPLQAATLNMCGVADKVIVTRENTTIIGAKGDKEKIKTMVDSLREKMKETKDDRERVYIESRIAKLTGGVAVLYVGAATESEAEEKKDRCDDAVRATKAAIEEGYLAGAGTVFVKMDLSEISGLSKDAMKGVRLIQEVLKEPLKKICANAGIESESIINQIKISPNGDGFNANTETIEDLIGAGVIDPAKVLRCSLQNAASAASMILTTECLFIC